MCTRSSVSAKLATSTLGGSCLRARSNRAEVTAVELISVSPCTLPPAEHQKGDARVMRVRTAPDLVRAAGRNLQFGALLGTDVTDGSSEEAGRDRSRSADSPDSPAHMKPTASSGGSPPSRLLRSTSQASEAARSSSAQKSRLQ
jgi:hypothetical protein